jgi:hypothetical protein
LPAVPGRPLLRARSAAVGLALVILLSACHVKVQVDAKVRPDGSGTVTVAVGLDRDAVRQAGDLRSQLRVSDLEAAGWKVTGPTTDTDGYTWIRASRDFADPAEFSAVMNQVNGTDGVFRDWKVTKKSSPWSTTWTASGSIDLRKGAAAFSDPRLDRSLGGQGFDGVVAQIERQQHESMDQLVDVHVSVQVPGASKAYAPTFAHASSVPVEVSSTRVNGVLGLVVFVLAVVVLAVVLLALRSRFATHRNRGDYQPRH